MRKNRSSPSPLKMPVQARSRATVDAIIQAATYILTEEGWDGLTTNAIAERAGVNIGSLYQYFPNKEAVIIELQRRHTAATHAELHKALERMPEQSSLRDTVALIIAMLVNEHRVAPTVHKAIAEELPRTVRFVHTENEQLRRQALAALQPFMRNVPDPELAIYMMSIALHAIMRTVTVERPALLDQARLVSELVAMVERFLCRSAEDEAPPS